jgi:NAD(P)-dependent dehydrogenase (short-subunit alcohol dehydrogenase family)
LQYAAGGRSRSFRAAIEDRLMGGLHIAFANAGVNTGDSDVETVTLEAWRRIFAINVEGALLTCRFAIGVMKSTPLCEGSIIIK